MFIMVRRNHMLLAVSVVSVGLNFLFFHYFSTLSSLADQSAGSDCNVLLGSANDKHLPSLDRRDLEKLIQMQISSGETEKQVDIPRLSKLVDHYVKQKLIFVLGSMSSGTTLMRLVLDTHPEINCGDETKIIELMLSFIEKTNGNEYFMKFMANTGIQNSTLEKATALFIYYVMENNFKTMNLTFLKNVKYLCNKEPMNTYYFPYLHRIFPRARFLYVIRDGRDMTYSYMRRNRLPMVFREFFQHISNWNRANTIGLDRCSKMGPDYCLMVKYESLVNEPETTINAITKFLGVDFVEDMLHHDDFLKSEKLSLTKVGFINKGVQRDKINNGSIGRYKNKIEGYDEDRIANDVSLLKKLSYI